MRLRLAPTVFLMSACAGHYRTELVGHGTASIVPRGPSVAGGNTIHGPASQAQMSGAPGSDAMPLARGTYDLALHFDLPHAQQIDWAVTCGGTNVTGSIGEPFERYRERRIAELRAQRDQDRRNVASLTGGILGAVAPTVRGHVESPDAVVDARVSGQAAGQVAGNAIAGASVADVIDLPPGDLGQGRLQTIVHLSTVSDGACAVTATGDGGVLGGFEITRVRDLDAEARLRMMAANTAARQVRTQLTTQLVAFGADVQARRLRLAAAAQARADAAAAISGRHEEQVAFSSRQHQAEIAISERQHLTEIAISERQHQTQIAISVRQRDYARDARARLSAQLVMWGADPQRRARLAAQARAASEAREAHLRVEIDLREHEEAVTRERREREETDRDHAVLVFAAHQRELAMSVRGELRTYLVSLGARERPPMPSPRPETPGMAPFDDASWIAGRWVWGDGQWSWETGGWHDPGHFSQTGGGEAGAHASAGVGIGFGSTDGSPGETPGGSSGGSTGSSTAYDTGVRDHRSTFVAPSTPTVRDHRDAPVSPPQAPAPTSTVRDHRSESSSSRKPDDKPKVRDHRR